MQDNDLYVETTVTVIKDNIVLFETDCEALVRYTDDAGDLDLEVLSFHFTACGTVPGRRIFTAIHAYEPLFYVLLSSVNMQHLQNAVFDHIAANDVRERNLLDV